MPVRITLRTNKKYVPFNEMLKMLIGCPSGDSVLLCSGYIQERKNDKDNFSILDDGLLESLREGCSNGRLITIAGKFYNKKGEEKNEWKDSYIKFIERIKNAGINITPCISSKLNWHAKIAMRLQRTTQGAINYLPVAGLIGSSNLTRPAWAIDYNYWNFEGDILLWPDDDLLNEYFGKGFNPDVEFGDMQLILDPKVRQHTEGKQLVKLYGAISHENKKGVEKFVY